MKSEKRWYQSKAIWAGVATVIAAVLTFLADRYDWGTGAVTSITSAVTALMAIIGRVTAKTRISKAKKKTAMLLMLLCVVSIGGCATMQRSVQDAANCVQRCAQQCLVDAVTKAAMECMLPGAGDGEAKD